MYVQTNIKNKSITKLIGILCLFFFISQSIQANCIYLKELKATKSEQDNQLTWSTLSETGNAFFLIERSLNGIEFEEAGRVEGAGTTTETKAYSFTDINNKGLRVFYRLLQVDVDGAVNFTNSVLVNRKEADAIFEITSLESSVTDRFFNMNISSTIDGSLEYRLQTRMGEIITKGKTTVVKGENAISIDLVGATYGTHQFSVRIKNEIEVIALRKVDEPVVHESILSIKNKE